ncbi:UNVERIFIED_CONTAM: hypothetical protein Cloal_1941 [Acetivibrio alkalicellulosi]
MVGKKRLYNDIFYTYFKKHYCLKCNSKMKLIKCSKIINSKSEEAKKYDFELGNTFLIGDIEFVWDELKCFKCGFQISIKEKKKLEREHKK